MEDKNAPTLKANKGIRFYNPGDRMSEPLLYSVEGADIHTVARYTIEAPEKDFFHVPTEVKFHVDNTRISVDFATTLCQKFKDRGLIMIDEEWEPGEDEDENDKKPFARDEEEAKEKGDRLWTSYLWSIVRRWKAQCERIRRADGVPEEASGFTKRALKILGMRDPALEHQQAIQREQSGEAKAPSNDEVSELRRQLDEQNTAIAQLIERDRLREEAMVNSAIETRTKAKAAKK